MVRAELMPFPQFSGAAAAGAPVAAARDALSAGAGYSPLGQDVAREVQQFIQQGSVATPALASAQAQWLAHQARQQLQKPSVQTERTERSVRVGTTPRAALTAEHQAFLQHITPWAETAAQRLGVSPRSIMAHAALESAWGQKPLRSADGTHSWNLFGLKASGTWQGERVSATTTEYVQGQAVKQVESFRQYQDLDASFADYVQLLAHSPRYRQALHTGDDVQAFAQGLAAGGYATDPDYASKLLGVSRLIAP